MVNIYAPNIVKDRCDFFKKTFTWIHKFACNHDNVLLCGDANCELNTNDQSSKILMKCLDNLNLVDIWSDLYQNDSGYTWCDANNTPKSRIDYMFVSNTFVYDIKSLVVRKVPGTHSSGTRMSDHKCLSLCMIINKNERGPGYWKFNVSLLKNEMFTSEMKDFILNFEVTDDPQTSWENLKHAIKSFYVNFSKRLSRSVKEKN